MAHGGGKSLNKAAESEIKSIHQRMTDAGQFSYGALCALCLHKLFEEDWNREFNEQTLSMILNSLEQPKQVQDSVRSMYQGVGQDDLHPFVEVILTQEAIRGDASPIISELISFAVSQGTYDARMRVLIKYVAWQLHVNPDHMEEIECEQAEAITSQKYEMSEEEKAEQLKKAKHRKYKRAALIGLATVTGGTLIGLTGGLAAPLVAAGAGAIIGGAGAAALGSVAGVAIIGSLFGVAGAGLTGYKMKKRVGAIEEFEFEPLISGGPLRLQTIRPQLHITIAITGWIDSKMPDFKQPWQNLAESQEQYALRWETEYLKDLGQALDYIFNSAVSMATHEALKYTVLSALMAAVTWPAALLSVSQVIDNPWSVALQRAVAAGRQLAEVLLGREQGKRPVTLIGYSLGGRVIFYCLEEMAKRKGSEGIVEDVIMLGSPVTSDPKSWSAFQRVVAGRIVNGYCRGDWLLKFLYRTTSVQLRIAGLEPVKWNNHRMHNINLTDVVSGHMDYVKQLDTILRVVGIRIRQGIKVSRKTGFGFDTVTSSEEMSATNSSSMLPTSDTTSPSCEGNLFEPAAAAADLSTPHKGSEGVPESDPKENSSQDAEKLADKSSETPQETNPSNPEFHTGRCSEEQEEEEQEEEAGRRVPASQTNPDQAKPSSRSIQGTSSLGGKLKGFFSSKNREASSPGKKRGVGRQEGGDLALPRSEDGAQNEAVENNNKQEVKRCQGVCSKLGGYSSAAHAADGENTATVRVDKRAGKGGKDGEQEEGKGDVGRGQAGPVRLEQVALKEQEKTNVWDEDSGEDSYTSSDPCSSAEDEKAPSQNEV